jgi:colicin import membrane protein
MTASFSMKAMDTTRDKLRAVVYALGVHALVFGLLFASLLSQHGSQASATQASMIEATLVSAPLPDLVAEQTAPSAIQQQAAPPQPMPAPAPEDATQPAHSDTVDQDNSATAAMRNADQEQHREEKTAASAAAQTTVAPSESAQTQAGSTGIGIDLEAEYRKAILQTANENWHHDGVPQNVHCHVQFKQSPGGDVFDVVFLDCPLDPAGRTSVLEALKRTPLPYAGFESVFLPQSTLDMCYPEGACFK